MFQRAEQIAREAKTWADLCNALYDPIEGLLVRAYPTRAEREEFVRTEEYRQIQQLLARAMEGEARLEGASPTRLTEFMVQFHLTLSPPADEPSKADFRVRS